MIVLMQDSHIPNGLKGLNYSNTDILGLIEGTYKQQRLLTNSPREATKAHLAEIYLNTLQYYW